MVYKVVGMMSGSSLDGMDLVFAELEETGGKWKYAILESACYPYPPEWAKRLADATSLSALDYMLLHSDYGHYIGGQVNRFIAEKQLEYRVGLIASHGHTTFHVPPRMTAQLGDGAAIAAETGLPVITDLRAMDLGFGGQGAPIVPVGEKKLLGQYPYFLNIGGIANISANTPEGYIAFDVCPANRVLNLLCREIDLEYDEGGKIASEGVVDQALLARLNGLHYYSRSFPKSLANDFGVNEVFPIIRETGISIPDALRTFVEHIALQVRQAMVRVLSASNKQREEDGKMLVTGGGTFNQFLISRIHAMLQPLGVAVEPADEQLANYKEALIMAFLGVLRWREESTVFSSVTGATKDSIGGALWMGQGNT